MGIGNIIGGTIKFAAKTVGTVVVGGVGLLASAVETATPLKEQREFSKSVSESCFGTVKKIWNPKYEGTSLSDSAEDLYYQASDLQFAIDDFKDDEMRKALENPEEMERLLRINGKNPQLAHNPTFMKKMREKYEYLL